MLVPGWRKRSLDYLRGLRRVAVAVNGDDCEWVWQAKDLALDKPVGCYDCKTFIQLSQSPQATAIIGGSPVTLICRELCAHQHSMSHLYIRTLVSYGDVDAIKCRWVKPKVATMNHRI